MIPVVGEHFGLHPSEDVYMRGFKDARPKQKDKLKVAFVEQKIAELLGPLSPFLYGNTNSMVTFNLLFHDLPSFPLQQHIAFGSPAITELIGNIAFNP